MYDLLFCNANVIDGTGASAFQANVAVKNGKIILPADPTHPTKEVINAAGKTICPGFIDVHSHGDRLFGTYAGQISKNNAI